MDARLVPNILFSVAISISARAAAPIELELATQQGLQITAPREWLQLLASIGINHVRIRGARAGDMPTADNRGTPERPRFYVLGIITPRNQLQVPGGTFGPADRRAIRDYFDRLAADGVEALTAPRGRFDLTQQEFETVFAELAQPIDFETQGRRPQDVVATLQSKLVLRFEVEPEAEKKLRAAPPLADELKGVSAGTGLAMLLRGDGLALRPQKVRGRPVGLRILALDPGSLAQSTLGKVAETDSPNWPIGWEPDAAPVHVAPSLFAELNAEIDGYTLDETLAAIRPRLAVPIYIDQAALAAAKIDPTAIQVKLPRARITYQRLLRRVLSQARLGTSLRVDEAGRPFVWITR